MQEDVKIIFRNGCMNNVEVFIGDKKIEHLHDINITVNSNEHLSENDRVTINAYDSQRDQVHSLINWKNAFKIKDNVISLSDATINALVSQLGTEFGSKGQEAFEQKANALISRITLSNKQVLADIAQDINKNAHKSLFDEGPSITRINKLIPKGKDNGRESN